MGPLAHALDNIKFRIPMQLLIEAFRDNVAGWRKAPVSLDERIMTKVIRPRVLVDCNLVGGQTTNVSLDGLIPDYVDTYSAVYHVPKERTQNRSILSVLSVGYMPLAAAYNTSGAGYGNISPQSMNAVTAAAQRVGDAVSGVPPVSNATVELIAENTIVMRDQFRVTAAYMLRCVLMNEENLNNLNPRSYLAFSKLVELAIKSYVYNTMIIKIDQAYIQGGQELGAFKSIVESYSDMEEQYQTYLKEVFMAVAYMNDGINHSRLLKLMLNTAL